jgi:DNA-binding transcriptional ArsR family regulator
MKSNKIDAFLHQINSGKRETDKVKILKIIKQKPSTLEHLTLYGYKIQTASARLSELEEMGLIRKMYNPNNSFSWFTYVENELEQKSLREKIETEKKMRYFAKGIELEYFYFDDNGELKINLKV